MNAATSLLTDPAALARELAGTAPPLVIDARWRLGGPPGADSYRAGHLPALSSSTWTAIFPDRRAAGAGIRCRTPRDSRQRCAGPG